MSHPTSDHPSRQVRRAEQRRRDKVWSQAERRQRRAATRASDRVQVICCACCGHPFQAWLEHAEEPIGPLGAPEASP